MYSYKHEIKTIVCGHCGGATRLDERCPFCGYITTNVVTQTTYIPPVQPYIATPYIPTSYYSTNKETQKSYPLFSDKPFTKEEIKRIIIGLGLIFGFLVSVSIVAYVFRPRQPVFCEQRIDYNYNFWNKTTRGYTKEMSLHTFTISQNNAMYIKISMTQQRNGCSGNFYLSVWDNQSRRSGFMTINDTTRFDIPGSGDAGSYIFVNVDNKNMNETWIVGCFMDFRNTSCFGSYYNITVTVSSAHSSECS